jgi:hypothetical protein
MCKRLRKYVLAIKHNKLPMGLFVIMVLVVLFQAVPALANFAQEIIVGANPDFNNSPPSVTTLGATDVYMDGVGTHATLVGSLDNLSKFPDADIWFEWGEGTNYVNTVGLQIGVTIGTYTYDLTGFNPLETVNYRIVGENPDGITYGDGTTLQITEGAVLSGFRVISLTPIVFMAGFIIMLIGMMLGGINLLSLITATVFIYMGMPLLDGLQNGIRAIWGG